MTDKLDKEYMKLLVARAIVAHDGKYPLYQLVPYDLEKWEGVNVQGHATTKPANEEDTLALYLIDADKQIAKRFTVTKTVLLLLGRGTSQIFYGTTDEEAHQFKIILQWEKEKRVSKGGK